MQKGRNKRECEPTLSEGELLRIFSCSRDQKGSFHLKKKTRQQQKNPKALFSSGLEWCGGLYLGFLSRSLVSVWVCLHDHDAISLPWPGVFPLFHTPTHAPSPILNFSVSLFCFPATKLIAGTQCLHWYTASGDPLFPFFNHLLVWQHREKLKGKRETERLQQICFSNRKLNPCRWGAVLVQSLCLMAWVLTQACQWPSPHTLSF